MQLNDNELASVCSINKYVNMLCANETFWLNRILLKLKKACEYASKIPFFKDINCNEFEGNLIQVKDYFGFTHYRELNTYLSKFTKGEQLSIFLFIIHSDRDLLHFETLLKKSYIIVKKVLPDFINYEKLMSYLRRKIVLDFYHLKNDEYYGIDMKLPGLNYNLLKKRTHTPEDEKRLRNINF